MRTNASLAPIFKSSNSQILKSSNSRVQNTIVVVYPAPLLFQFAFAAVPQSPT